MHDCDDACMRVRRCAHEYLPPRFGLSASRNISRADAQQATDRVLPNKVYHNGQIPYAGDAEKKGREFFHGTTHSDFDLQMHETILGPGIQTHAPHKHEHEEIVIVLEGTMEAWMEGKTELAEAGSVVYFSSNRMHSANGGERAVQVLRRRVARQGGVRQSLACVMPTGRTDKRVIHYSSSCN